MSAARGVRQRDAALAEVQAHYAPQIRAGLAVLAKWAKAGDPFSANDVRAELIEAGVDGPARGQCFQVAIKDGILRRVGEYETSTDPGTHGKALPRYVRASVAVAHRPEAAAGEVIDVPVKRSSSGRFTAAADVPIAGQTDIFQALAEAASP